MKKKIIFVLIFVGLLWGTVSLYRGYFYMGLPEYKKSVVLNHDYFKIYKVSSEYERLSKSELICGNIDYRLGEKRNVKIIPEREDSLYDKRNCYKNQEKQIQCPANANLVTFQVSLKQELLSEFYMCDYKRLVSQKEKKLFLSDK